MVTKIKPRRVNSEQVPEWGDKLGYEDPSLFGWSKVTGEQADWNETDPNKQSYILNRPKVEDSTTSDSPTDVLSANQWKLLSDRLDNVEARWRFLSLWNATTWLPETDPSGTIPYDYKTWDYYIVGEVWENNLRPSWTTYTWAASTTPESDEVASDDNYIFDGTTWILQINHWKSVSFANLAGEPHDNTALWNELDAKVDEVTTANKVYGTDNSWNQTTYTVATNATASTIPVRGGNGVVSVWTPTANTHATTKKYVDDAIAVIPEPGNWSLTIQKNWTTITPTGGTFTANKSSDSTINITVPTKVTDLTDESNYAKKTELNDKVDKTTSVSRLYWTNSAWEQTVYSVSSGANASSVAYRSTWWTLAIGTPTADNHAATKKYVDDALQEIQDLKVPNATIVGTPTIVSGNISNFTTTNYLIAPFLSSFSNNPFILHMDFTTGTDVATQQNIVDSTYWLAFAISGGKFIMALSTNWTGWNVGQFTGTYSVQTNTDYHVEIERTGSAITLKYSTTGTSFTTDISTSLSTPLSWKTLYFWWFGATSHPFKGTFNFNERWFKSNGTIVWQWMDSAGLETRANVSLSNLDEEWEKRFARKLHIFDMPSVWTNMTEHLDILNNGGSIIYRIANTSVEKYYAVSEYRPNSTISLYRLDSEIERWEVTFNASGICTTSAINPRPVSLASWGTTWQVLTKTETWYDWEDSKWWADSWVWSSAEYEALTTHEAWKLYFVY